MLSLVEAGVEHVANEASYLQNIDLSTRTMPFEL